MNLCRFLLLEEEINCESPSLSFLVRNQRKLPFIMLSLNGSLHPTLHPSVIFSHLLSWHSWYFLLLFFLRRRTLPWMMRIMHMSSITKLCFVWRWLFFWSILSCFWCTFTPFISWNVRRRCCLTMQVLPLIILLSPSFFPFWSSIFLLLVNIMIIIFQSHDDWSWCSIFLDLWWWCISSLLRSVVLRFYSQ